MADDADDTTLWIPFIDLCIERAAGIPITDPVTRLREAEQLTLGRICRRELEISWLDVNGCRHTGLPNGWVGIGARYDPYRDAIVEQFPFGGALYQPRVRERRQCKPANPVDTSTMCERASEPAALPVNSAPGSDDLAEGTLITTDRVDTASLTVSVTPRRWPWIVTPDSVRPTSHQARCRKDLEEHFQPDDILVLTAPKIQKKLEELGPDHHYELPTIKRATMRKDWARSGQIGPVQASQTEPDQANSSVG
jgi:hypothetical protein